jgi:hypothetical protein
MAGTYERILASTHDAHVRSQIHTLLDSTFRSYVARAASCRIG